MSVYNSLSQCDACLRRVTSIGFLWDTDDGVMCRDCFLGGSPVNAVYGGFCPNTSSALPKVSTKKIVKVESWGKEVWRSQGRSIFSSARLTDVHWIRTCTKTWAFSDGSTVRTVQDRNDNYVLIGHRRPAERISIPRGAKSKNKTRKCPYQVHRGEDKGKR